MPYTITTKDGIVISGIPDDTPKDSPDLKARVQAIRAQRASQAAAPTQPSTMAAPQVAPVMMQEPGVLDTVSGYMAALGRGIAPVAAGAGAGALMGAPFAGVGALPGAIFGGGSVVTANLVTNLVNAVLGTNYQSPDTAMQAILTKLGVKEPEKEGEKILKSIAQGAAEGMGGAGLFGPASALTRQAVAAQGVMGATGAAGSEVGTRGAEALGLSPSAQMAAGLAGGLAGASGGARTARLVTGTVTPAAQSAQQIERARIVEAGRAAGVPVMTSDILRPGTFAQRMAQSIGEKVPIVGTGPVRAAQQTARVSAVESFLRDQGARSLDPTADVIDVASDLQRTRGIRLGDLLKKKNDVISMVSRPDLPVDVSGTKTAVDEQVAALGALPGPQAKAAAALLVDFKDKLDGKTLAQVEELRKVIGDSLKSPDLASIRTRSDKAIDAIYGSLRQDMSKHIETNAGPGQLAKWKDANKKLSMMAKELDRFAELKTALNQGDERVGAVVRMINSTDQKVIKKLYDNLSPQGQASMRASIVSDIASKSGGIENISPEKFLTQIKAKANQLGVVLEKDEMSRLKGLQRVIKSTSRASQAALAPPTGIQALPVVAGGALVGALGTGGGALAGLSIGALARGFESPVVRDLLIKMPSFKPGSKQEFEAAKKVLAAIGTVEAEQQPTAR